ncbi:hypothetical protein IW261DRAFT_1419801 [Armillaria novae-zelandiae]|uniref:BTB domain-containing protein n=1 Tax=Armillaria novae-zelandiae TaxID=153914 RepID=A0AA39UAW6_9AGAR|nr:hypothetical protein IW261DRAFT_1419795 [Armillaria novae-zelandiae]KAK0479722.1 hypothetical protein IW261DRAFT_1625331 [Armillaria novae-zelandiae]KAK0479725.1 hypothetical protein IW261DRAFT_1419799 [Armillaria novae-zelandiae]KAK0479728.1 hypothetical protein IW261DRAFT_1419801 [Armillaria novae-zelandiae]
MECFWDFRMVLSICLKDLYNFFLGKSDPRRGLLSLKSPSSFFRHVLKNSQHTEEKDGFPVLEVMEDSDTFCTILYLCYPDVAAPEIKSIDQIKAVKAALDKYCMDRAQEKFTQAVIASSLMKEQALRMFAHAIANGWRVLGEAAAKSTLAIPLEDPEVELEDLNYINTLQYVRLRNYHRKCRLAVQVVFSNPRAVPWLEGKESELLFVHDPSRNQCQWCGAVLEYDYSDSSPRCYTHRWFPDYVDRVKAEVLRRPCSEIALDDVIIAHAVSRSVYNCSNEEWKKIAASQVRLGGKYLMEKIDRQISQVPLNIDWTK